MINVLIVEDDPMVSEMNSFYLGQVEGFRVMGSARSAAEALQKLEERNFDLMLLDIYMKDTSGLELLSIIRRGGLRLDVIVISAASDMESIQEALQNGAIDYLIKPFQFVRFREALTVYREQNELIKGRQSLRQSELDQLIRFRQEQGAVQQELSKGFTRHTLQKVWSAVEECSADVFSAEDIARLSGISRVSVGKYLAGLAELGALELEVFYGSVGRPVQKYRVSLYGRAIVSKFT